MYKWLKCGIDHETPRLTGFNEIYKIAYDRDLKVKK